MDNENWINYALLNSDSVPNLLLELEKETYQKVLQPRMKWSSSRKIIVYFLIL